MTISIEQVSRRYQTQWVLRHLNLKLHAGNRYAVVGPNGSGKTTLLHLLAGFLLPTSGQIRYLMADRYVPGDEVYRYLSFAAPYVDLLDAFTVQEHVRWHARIKPFRQGIGCDEALEVARLSVHAGKRVGALSSGLRQRLMLAMTVLADTPLLFLDEPTTNLDQEGVAWYQHLIQQHADNRLVVIASNQEADLVQCNERLQVMTFK
ncbi:MAG: ATP-binding cassette domain-containing protein [Chitinophagales bacterium]|nr:ATP-binding cassette domain-containing protein [Chitinophagales bacterium]MDW8394330.1 ATP-binding cassette domain-containing protein [Chitinophagales bacterium]